MSEENFDFFEQQSIMNGETTPADIITERKNEDLTTNCGKLPFCLNDKTLRLNKVHSGWMLAIPREDVKEFIKRDTEFLDINENLIGFQLSDVVVTAINLMFSQRTKKLAGEGLI